MKTQKTKRQLLSGSPKVPPQSIEAEQAVLGSLLLAPTAWDQVADVLTSSDFYREDHRLVFQAIGELQHKGRACDAVTVTEWFESHDNVDLVDGGEYINQLANNTPSAANIVAYAEIVLEKSILRRLLDAVTNIAASTYFSDGRDARELLEDAESQVYAIADKGNRRGTGFVGIRETTTEVWKLLEERAQYDDDITGLATGFLNFDELTSGLQPADLIIVAGRPSMGKTAFAMNVAEYAAIRQAKAVGVFSMEMSAPQLVLRLLSSISRVDQKKLRTANMKDEEWVKVTSAIKTLNDSRIFIDETPALSPVELRSRARRLKHAHGIDLLVIDYLQLMQVPGHNENRATEIAEISRSLKALAKELDIPIVAISQLNRALEQRQNKRPVMSDLRESGAIEQDADLIVFIYRDEIYDKNSMAAGTAEIIIGKHRNGEIGMVKLQFDGRWVRFANYAAEPAWMRDS